MATLVFGKSLIPKNLGVLNVDDATEAKFAQYNIIEFTLKNNKFVPLHGRPDKTFANNILSSNDAYDAMVNQVTTQILRKGIYVSCIRKYHNDIKRDIILKFARQRSVLDIGSGAGGDAPLA